MPNIPIVLVGNQVDLRIDPSHLKRLAKYKQKPITSCMGEKLAREINAVAYVESSCADGTGVENVFEEAVWVSICNKPKKKHSEKQCHF